MRPWQFGKPKTPGFGIGKGTYLSVLASTAVMPSLQALVEPQAHGGAVEGFGAPLNPQATKEALTQPLARGAYAIASKDKKTVLRMLVLSRDEAGFDPEAFARSALALEVSEETVARIRATWTLAQFTFESHDPMVYAAMDFLLDLTTRLAELADGVVADPICQRYLLPEQVRVGDRVDPRIDAREHVAVKFRQRPQGLSAYTLGLQKFVLPELELTGIAETEQALAARLMLTVAQRSLLGDLVRSGDRFGARRTPFEAREAPYEPFWEATPVFDLIPPTGTPVGAALAAWRSEAGL